MNSSIKLNIADVIVEMQSKFPMQTVESEGAASFRFNNFIYKGSKAPDVKIKINIVDKLPEFSETEVVFITYHFEDGSENWRLLKKDSGFIYKSPLEDKRQVMAVNKEFNKVDAYLLPKKYTGVLNDEKGREFVKRHNGFVWHITDVIYDFLQVFLINYLAVIKKDGVFVHGMGVKDVGKAGFLFAGKSGAGKSTLARIYHKDKKALVLNDDRIIVRKTGSRFYMYGCPWHGDFNDYLESRIDRAELKGIFFLNKSEKNSLERISIVEGFKCLYPAMFPVFWDKKGTEWTGLFLTELLGKVNSYKLKFKKDSSVIQFLRESKL